MFETFYVSMVRRIASRRDRSDARSCESDPPGLFQLQIARMSRAMIDRNYYDDYRQDRGAARRSCPEMAPQQLEKIESAPGNGMVSVASKPQHLVHGRATTVRKVGSDVTPESVPLGARKRAPPLKAGAPLIPVRS